MQINVQTNTILFLHTKSLVCCYRIWSMTQSSRMTDALTTDAEELVRRDAVATVSRLRALCPHLAVRRRSWWWPAIGLLCQLPRPLATSSSCHSCCFHLLHFNNQFSHATSCPQKKTGATLVAVDRFQRFFHRYNQKWSTHISGIKSTTST